MQRSKETHAYLHGFLTLESVIFAFPSSPYSILPSFSPLQICNGWGWIAANAVISHSDVVMISSGNSRHTNEYRDTQIAPLTP
jgi:hypothetical protein